jgi:hypothetical protein
VYWEKPIIYYKKWLCSSFTLAPPVHHTSSKCRLKKQCFSLPSWQTQTQRQEISISTVYALLPTPTQQPHRRSTRVSPMSSPLTFATSKSCFPRMQFMLLSKVSSVALVANGKLLCVLKIERYLNFCALIHFYHVYSCHELIDCKPFCHLRS